MKATKTLIAMTVATSVVFAGVALAADVPTKPIPEQRQARLLERFADEGIDADGDGTLTREEVKTFFAEHPDSRPEGKRGFGKGQHDRMRHKGHKRGNRVGMLLRRLDRLDSQTVPEGFELTRHPEADVDGDGELSASEWTAFSQQARAKLIDRLLKLAPEADTDGDGVLSDSEIEAFKETCKAEREAQMLERHPEADTDGDGVLSDEEIETFKEAIKAKHAARLLERHPEADLDGDGAISDEELEAFRKDRPAHGGKKGKFRGHRPGKKGPCPFDKHPDE